jgi:predicted O-methyltransferase YrrM
MDEFLAEQPRRYVMQEGCVTPEQRDFFIDFLAKHPNVSNILEIGFNGGCSSATLLGCNDSIRVTSVDIGVHSYVPVAKQLIDEVFPFKHTLLIGDSRIAVPMLKQMNVKYDMIFVDGGHIAPIPDIDLRNVHALLRDGGWIVMDDYCVQYGSHGVIQAWDNAVRKGLYTQVSVHEAEDRGWVLGVKGI